MNAFFQDLGTALRPYVTVVTSTEFGRTFGENGGGAPTTATARACRSSAAAPPAGSAAAARSSRASGRDNETTGTTDYRDVLTEGLTWLGVRNAASVFPGHTFSPVGAFKK